METKHPVHIMVFGKISDDIDCIYPLIFPHSLRLNTEASINCLVEVELNNSKQAEELGLCSKKVFVNTSPQTSSSLTPQNTIPD